MLYIATTCLSAFLLFQVQLIVAKYILPWYGGSASVWTMSLLFFQLILLLGYSYSHLLVSLSGFRRQAQLHLMLLAASLLIMTGLSFYWGSPILAAETWKPLSGANPVSEIFLLFSASIGIPFLLLSATSPLLQCWIGHLQPDRSPYRLYAFSNLGSLIGLLSYPFLIEPLLRLTTQAWVWALLYLAFTLSCSTCAWTITGNKAVNHRTGERAPYSVGLRPRATNLVFWFSLTFCSSALLLAVTSQICQEIAVVPFLWVLPLSLYLLSFFISFHHERWYRRRVFLSLMALSTVLILDLLSAPLQRAVTDQIVVFSLFLFAACMTCHGELVRQKPPTSHLTSFYLMVALGGAGGGIFVGGLAPHLFTGYWELHLGILVSWALVFFSILRDKASFMYRPSIRVSFLFITTILLGTLYCMTYSPPGFLQEIGGNSYLYYGLAGILALIFDSLHQVRALLPFFPVLQPAVLLGLGVFSFVFFTSRTSRTQEGRSLKHWWIRTSWFSLLVILSWSLWQNVGEYYQDAVSVSRSFYGISKVLEKQTPSGDLTHSLLHGQTLHGLQLVRYPKLPTTYFGDRSGIGILMRNYVRNDSNQSDVPGRRIGVLGLGVGTLAAYGSTGDVIRFYEINPDVQLFAEGERGYFTYIEESDALIEISSGDARITLEEELNRFGSQQFDILVMDAFSSDSVPLHLLTREAFEVYLDHLRPEGVLAVNITNRFLDLKPVVQGIARSFGLHMAIIHDSPGDPFLQASTWTLLSFEDRHFNQPPISLVRSEDLDPTAITLWTDDFSNLFEVVKF